MTHIFKKTAVILFALFLTHYILSISFKLLTYPNDLAVMAGASIFVLASVAWLHVLVEALKKLIREKHEKQHKDF